MIVYLDTSAIVKLFVEEPNSDRVRQAVKEARLVFTHLIAYAEACAAFARLARDRKDPVMFGGFRDALERVWGQWEIVLVDERLIRRAGELAHIHGLRGYDSVHLAAAESVFSVVAGQSPFCFPVFDTDLARGARAAGLPVLGG